MWAECLNKKLKELGYTQLATDQCVYAKWSNWDLTDLNHDSHFVFILVHSDDLIIILNLKKIMLREKETLLQAFDGVDQGILSSFCGAEVDITDNGIKLSMEYYWEKNRKRFGISANAKEDKPTKNKSNGPNALQGLMRKERKPIYRSYDQSSLVGYTHCRLDLAFAVGMLTLGLCIIPVKDNLSSFTDSYDKSTLQKCGG